MWKARGMASMIAIAGLVLGASGLGGREPREMRVGLRVNPCVSREWFLCKVPVMR
jgi:hypothetical protein